MKQTSIFTAIAIAAALSLTSHAGHAAGYKTDTLPVEHRDTPLPLFIWYPSDATETNLALGKNAVFIGVDVTKEAPQSRGQHPLVLLSHGSGGNAVNIAWIAAELADQGYIVVSTNHPHTTSRDSIPAETIKLWERPADFSAILDYLEQGGLAGITPDMSRVVSMGFSLGGHTALALAGARVDQADYVEHCEINANQDECQWYAAAGVDIGAVDKTRFEQSNRDPRISAAIAIDPAAAQAYNPDSLAAMDLPVQIINLGDPEQIPASVNAIKMMGILPNADFQAIPEAWHFSFLAQCTTLGRLVIAVAGDDPICTEIGNRRRVELHADIQASISRFLENAHEMPLDY